MKKIIVLSAILFVTVFMLTGCGNSKQNAKTSNNNSDIDQVIDNNTSSNSSSSNTAEEKIDLYSDDTKIVFINGQSSLVFYYSGDEITAYHAYYDYATEANARVALNVLEKDESIDKAYVKGRYLVVEFNKSEFEDLKLSEIRQVYSYLEEAKKSN